MFHLLNISQSQLKFIHAICQLAYIPGLRWKKITDKLSLTLQEDIFHNPDIKKKSNLKNLHSTSHYDHLNIK